MSKIISLKSENVKRLHAVEITPSGGLVVIGGNNGQGKSSVLDSIEYALGGKPDVEMPVRRGEETARIVLELDDLVVTRKLTADGGDTLVVTNKDGIRQGTPQAILDKLVGKLSFDPLDFSRQKPARQSEILQALVGLDFTAEFAQRSKLYEERTIANREVQKLTANLTNFPKVEGEIPTEEISTVSVLEQQTVANLEVQQNRAERNCLKNLENAKIAHLSVGAALRDDIARLQSKLKDWETEAAGLHEDIIEQTKKVQSLVDPDTSGFAQKLADLEAANRRFRDARFREAACAHLKEFSAKHEKLTEEIAAIDKARNKKVAEAKYPIEGLSFTKNGVLYNGIPFEQCSSAEQLKVSVAIGLALNPSLKILLVRDGSLLDTDSLLAVKAMADAAGAQIWMERVGVDAQTSVVISDGSVAK